MTKIERRTVDELLARYDLEPTLQDVYVEGSFDREVLSRCFDSGGQAGRIVYEVDGIEISGGFLRKEGLTGGNKQRLIALARALASIEHGIACKCLVDMDLDHWFGPLEANSVLVWTNYCSIDLYFFTDEILRDLLIVAARIRIQNWGGFLNSMTNVLLDLYSMRLADRELQWSMEWMAAYKHLVAGADRMEFDCDEYISRLLMKNRHHKERDIFCAAAARWRSALSCDPRKSIRGHDFLEILEWVIRAFRGIPNFASVRAIEGIFLLAVPKISELLDLFSSPKGD